MPEPRLHEPDLVVGVALRMCPYVKSKATFGRPLPTKAKLGVGRDWLRLSHHDALWRRLALNAIGLLTQAQPAP